MRIKMNNGKVYFVHYDRSMDVIIAAHWVGLNTYRRETWRRISPRADVLKVYDRLK